MAVVRPTSGSTIDKTDITAMHDTVKNSLNAMTKDNVARACFGHQHFQASTNGLVLFSSVNNELSVASVSTESTNEGANFKASHQVLITKTLNQSFLSFTGNVYVLVQFSCRVGEYQNNAGVNKNPEEEVMAIFGILHTYVNSSGTTITDELKAESVRCVHFPHNKEYDSTSSAKTQEITVSLSCVLKFESNEQMLTNVKAIASKIKGNAPSPYVANDKYTIDQATLTILGLWGD